ncbi:type IV pilus modification PilV family protein [Inconstantimicrobium mannanitabidum]|uniref:Uncharacterized protein n=1 Tax=Inconstantimicrobium mannanitabidum TaxID=1604901 RepID=A0ACB5R752_9CLOT|nr:type II secretion system protein [Clostridium sp. TW13]GKX64843.1 hypothetical protein rsdtw13_01010 [Clostridium sp. TW13]
MSEKKKGFTLIELIISIALIGILLVPVSSMVLTTVRTNKRAEVKQKATLVGQKVLEQLRAVNIAKQGTSFNFTGITFDNNVANNVFVLNNVDSYKVTVTLNVKNTLESANTEEVKYDGKYSIGVRNEQPTIISQNSSNPADVKEVPDNKIIIKVQKSGNDRIVDINNGEINETVTTKDASGNPSSDPNDKKDLNLALNFSKYILTNQSQYAANPVYVNVYNQDDKYVNLCLQKTDNIIVNVNQYVNPINIYNNRPEDPNAAKIGDMYDIMVEVTKDNSSLFVGHAVKNIK